jgi:hypothetical protein
MKSFLKLLAGVAVGLIVVIAAAANPLAKTEQDPVRVAQADKIRSVSVGDSDLYFHFEQTAQAFELHVMVVTNDDRDDILQTRVRMRDDQQFSMVLHDHAQDADQQGHRVIFHRVGASILVDAKEAPPEQKFASIIWPFN